MMYSKKRIDWLDALRGLGMIFVIAGHMAIPEILRQAIFSFHMPLFFYISGYLYKGDYGRKWILKKVDTLIVPYIVYSCMICIAWDFTGKADLSMTWKGVLLGNGVGITWFFTCLFVVEIIGGYLVTRKSFCSTIAQWVWIGIFAVAGWILPTLGLPIILKSATIMPALVFWLLGYVLKSYIQKLPHFIAAILMSLFFVVQRVDMNSAQYGNGFLFYGTALGFIVLLFGMFQRLSVQWWPLMFMGRRSLEFMCLHSIIPMILIYGVTELGWGVPKFLMRIVSLSIVVFAAWGIHKYSKIFSGQLYLFQKFAK